MSVLFISATLCNLKASLSGCNTFDASLVIYINSTNIPPLMIINRIYENQNLLSLQIVSFLIGLRTYQHPCIYIYIYTYIHRGADKSLARPTSRCILFDGQNITFDASLVIYINSTNIPPIMIINRIYENQNLLSLQLVSFLVGLRTYQHSCIFLQLLESRAVRHEELMELSPNSDAPNTDGSE